MDIQSIVSHETARQDAYKSLANLYHLPEKNIQENLDVLTEQLIILNSKAVSYLTNMQIEFDQNSDLDLLKVEFTRLFIGPYSLPTPPYGSVYIENERKVMGDSTMDAQKRYQHFGLDIPANFKDVPDHITVELEFIFFLIFKEIVHIQSNEPEHAQELLFHQKSFHTDHLNIWIPIFTDCVIEHACIEFYRNLATATKIFIGEELEYLKNVYISVTQS